MLPSHVYILSVYPSLNLSRRSARISQSHSLSTSLVDPVGLTCVRALAFVKCVGALAFRCVRALAFVKCVGALALARGAIC